MASSERVYTPPDDEQLLNFVAVRVYGPGAPDHVKEMLALLVQGEVKERWLAEHRRFQEMAWALADEHGE